MAAKLENRVLVLEMQNRLLQRELARSQQRIANPLTPKNGRWLGELESTLTPGGTANVVLKVPSHGDLEDSVTIQIKDFTLPPGKNIPAETKVWVYWYRTIWTWDSVYRPDEEDDHFAWFIGFSITNTSGGLMKANNDQMQATVDYIIDGNTPPVDGSGEITVHDDQEVCPNAIAGAMGWAIRNDHLGSEEDPYYQILTCNQMCRQASAILDQTMDGSETQVNIRNFFPDDESPEGLDAIEPFRSFALNPHRRKGINGFLVRLRWGNDASQPFGIPRQGYIIEDVQRSLLEMPVNFRLDTDKKLKAQYVDLAIETDQSEIANNPFIEIFRSKNCT